MNKKDKEKKWFKNLEKARKNFRNVENLIEGIKFNFENTNRIYEWVIGVAVALLISLGIADVLNSITPWIKVTGFVGYIISFLLLLISIFLDIIMNNRQNKVIMWLYREKDNQKKK